MCASAQRLDQLTKIVAFLNLIGIETTEGVVGDTSFLPGVCIRDGTLVYSATLPWPGDLLHEAGHIACAPASVRPRLSDSVALPEHVEFATEVEATAWAFAALTHLGLAPEVLFHAGGYQGASEGLIATFVAGVFPGAHGLSRAGMTRIGEDADAAGVPAYPHMTNWLRP